MNVPPPNVPPGYKISETPADHLPSNHRTEHYGCDDSHCWSRQSITRFLWRRNYC